MKWKIEGVEPKRTQSRGIVSSTAEEHNINFYENLKVYVWNGEEGSDQSLQINLSRESNKQAHFERWTCEKVIEENGSSEGGSENTQISKGNPRNLEKEWCEALGGSIVLLPNDLSSSFCVDANSGHIGSETLKINNFSLSSIKFSVERIPKHLNSSPLKLFLKRPNLSWNFPKISISDYKELKRK